MSMADLKPGETVLDLGSGAGFDAFLAAKRVGESGKVDEGGLQVKSCLLFKVILGVIFLVLTAGLSLSNEHSGDFSNLPVKGTVTMIDLGAERCIPCKMMAPIMKKMEEVYRDKAAIVFIDVWENREQVVRFGIRSIPTQIFFDSGGKEVHRHVGFMSEKEIIAQLKKMGID